MSGRNWTRKSIEELVEQYLKGKKGPNYSTALAVSMPELSAIGIMDSEPFNGDDYVIEVGDLISTPETVRTITKQDVGTLNFQYYEALQQLGNPNYIYGINPYHFTPRNNIGLPPYLSGYELLGLSWGYYHRYQPAYGAWSNTEKPADYGETRKGSYAGCLILPNGFRVPFTTITIPKLGISNSEDIKKVLLGVYKTDFEFGDITAIVTSDPVNESYLKELGSYGPLYPEMGTLRINRSIYFPCRKNGQGEITSRHSDIEFLTLHKSSSELRSEPVTGTTTEKFNRIKESSDSWEGSILVTDPNHLPPNDYGDDYIRYGTHYIDSSFSFATAVGKSRTTATNTFLINAEDSGVHKQGYIQYDENDATKDRPLNCYTLIMVGDSPEGAFDYASKEDYVFVISRMLLDQRTTWDGASIIGNKIRIYTEGVAYGTDLPLFGIEDPNNCVVKYSREYVATNTIES